MRPLILRIVSLISTSNHGVSFPQWRTTSPGFCSTHEHLHYIYKWAKTPTTTHVLTKASKSAINLGTVGSECWHAQNIPWHISRGSALHEVLKCNCCHSESWLCGHSLVVKSRLEAWIQLSCLGYRVFSGPQQTACKGREFGWHHLWLYLRVMPLKI